MLNGLSALSKAQWRSEVVLKAYRLQFVPSSAGNLAPHLSPACVARHAPIQLGIGSTLLQSRSYYTSGAANLGSKDPEAQKRKRIMRISNPVKKTGMAKPPKTGAGSRDKVKRVPLATGVESLTEEQLARRIQEFEEDDGEWEFEAGANEGDVEEWNRELDGDWELEGEIEDPLMDAEGEILAHEEQGKSQAAYERSMAKKAKNKEKILEKRRARDELMRERYKDMTGLELDERDGLVGLAEKQARANPDESGVETQRQHIINEVMERTGGRKPRNTHPQAPGGRQTRIDTQQYPDNVLWPDRHVNIHMEFPSTLPKHRLEGASDPAAAGRAPDFWLQEHDRPVAPPKLAVDLGIVSQEEAAAKTREALHLKPAGLRGANEHEPHKRGAFEEDDLDLDEEAESSAVKKGLAQRKREKREAELPDWAKTPVALDDITVHKAIHGKGRSTHGQASPSSKSHPEDSLNMHGVSFRDLGISAELTACMRTNWNISAPTEIQALTIPPFIDGTNLLIADQTGTGKTLAYVLPLLERLIQFNIKNPFFKRRGQRARALVLLPNRELVQQTYGVISTLIDSDPRFAEFTAFSMAGGMEPIKKETAKLNAGYDVLVSTPDRVLLHVEHEHLYLDDTTIVVFDEADTLMSSIKSNVATQSFMQLIRDVISRQTVTHAKHVQFISASATVSPPLMEFLKKEFGNSMTSVVGSGVHKSAQTLQQHFLFGSSGDFKKRLLFATLKKYPGKRTMIFTNTQGQAKGVNTLLQKAGYNSVAMTSDMPPKIRQRHFHQFLNKEADILVATDLASRGLDMGATVEHVILYDFPTNTIDYLHRIGRTARAGASGIVNAFLGRSDQALASTIRDAVQDGKSLSTIRPSKPDMKYINALKRKVPKRMPKRIDPADHLEKEL